MDWTKTLSSITFIVDNFTYILNESLCSNFEFLDYKGWNSLVLAG